MTKKITVGLPRALLYFRFEKLWQTFFTELGCNVVVSPQTNKEILKNGSILSIDENCLPVKAYMGHVKYLLDKVDFVVVPRIVSIYASEQSCNKFMGMYDNVVSLFGEEKLLGYSIDQTKNETEFAGLFKMGMRITKNPIKIWRAYNTAKRCEVETAKQLIENQDLEIRKSKKGLRIMVFAHPYIIRDGYFGRPVISFLEKEGVSIVYSDLIESEAARKLSKNISTDMYITEFKEMMGAVEKYRKKVDGIIFLSGFPCGPDAFVIEMCRRKVKEVPSMVLVMDELQGEIGMMTRLESFIDILRLKNAKKNRKKES